MVAIAVGISPRYQIANREVMGGVFGIPSTINAIGKIIRLANINAAAEKEIRPTLGQSRVIIDPTE